MSKCSNFAFCDVLLSPRSFAVGRAPRSFAVGLANIVPPDLRNLTFDVKVTKNMMAERALLAVLACTVPF